MPQQLVQQPQAVVQPPPLKVEASPLTKVITQPASKVEALD